MTGILYMGKLFFAILMTRINTLVLISVNERDECYGWAPPPPPPLSMGIKAEFAKPGWAPPCRPNLEALYERYEYCHINGPCRGTELSIVQIPIMAVCCVASELAPLLKQPLKKTMTCHIWTSCQSFKKYSRTQEHIKLLCNNFKCALLNLFSEPYKRILNSLFENYEYYLHTPQCQ